jgi:hypothetical protein
MVVTAIAPGDGKPEVMVGSEWGKPLSRRTQASQGWGCGRGFNMEVFSVLKEAAGIP